jgi:hypothetical protein
MGQSAAPLRKVGQGRFSNVCSPKRLACFVRLITPAPKQLLQVLFRTSSSVKTSGFLSIDRD